MGEASEGQGSEFTSVLASSLIDRQAAQSGNQLPQSGEREADTGHDDTRPLLRNLRLQSGLQIVVGGTVPSEAGLSAFAQSQGIDPAVLENLLDDHGRGAATNAGHTAGLIQPQGPVNTDAAEALTKEQLREQLGRMSPVGKEAGAQQPSKEQIRDSLAQLSPTGKDQTQTSESADGLTKAQIREQLARITSTASDTGNKDFIAGWATNSQEASAGLAPAVEILLSQRQMADAGLTSGIVNPSRVQRLISTEAQVVAKQAIFRAEAPTDTELSIGAKQLAEAVREGNTFVNKSPSNSPVGAQPELQAAAGRLLFKNLMDKHSAGGHAPLERANSSVPLIKLEAINLLAPASPVLTAESAFIPAQQSFSPGQDALTAARLPEDPLQQAMRKQEEAQEMSRRLTEALGQRLTAQITRGAWRVEMDLHPKSLGRIEIQLEMKNGELEANFHSANSATRELLADSMPRLRAALEEHGMETAYIGLELANQGGFDGNSTGQEQSDRREGDNLAENAESPVMASKNKISDDGLNVLV
jgi:flagellar hook-length control protein FliK